MHSPELRVLFSREQIEGRIREIASEINSLYAGQPLVMICVLKGAFMFFADLVKYVTVNPEIDFVRAASYGSASSSSGVITVTKDVELPLENKHVLLVEDVIDSGRTLEFLMGMMSSRGALSIRLAALVDKKERRENDLPVDFTGFTVASGFIVGYGLDFAEKYRNLPAIYVLDMENQKKDDK